MSTTRTSTRTVPPLSRETLHVLFGVALCSVAGVATLIAVGIYTDVATVTQNPDWEWGMTTVTIDLAHTVVLGLLPAVLTVGYLRLHRSIRLAIESAGTGADWPRLRTGATKLIFGVGVTASIALGNILWYATFTVFGNYNNPIDAWPSVWVVAGTVLIVGTVLSAFSIVFSLAFLAGYSRFANTDG